MTAEMEVQTGESQASSSDLRATVVEMRFNSEEYLNISILLGYF